MSVGVGARVGDRAGAGTDVEVVLVDALPEGERGRLVASLLGLRVAPGQEQFVGTPAEVIDAALADPDRHLLAVLRHGEVVGLGVLHPGGAPAEVVALLGGVDAADAVLFRGFLVDVESQGTGVGTSVTALLPGAIADLAHVRRRAVPYDAVVLTVNERNAAGLRAYARAGMTDVGAYLGGSAGPQRVMARALGPGHL